MTSGLFSLLLRRVAPPGAVAWLPAATVSLALLALASCASGPPSSVEEGPTPEAPLPALEDGEIAPAAAAEAAGLLRDARRALRADSAERAAELAERVAEDHPAAPGSSEALWILARAAREVGDAERAAAAAEALAELLPTDHPLILPNALLRADASMALGRWRTAVEVYLAVPASAPDSARTTALSGIRRAVPELSFRALEDLSETGPDGWERLRAPLAAERALALHARGRTDEAEAEARRALELGADAEMGELARSVLAGEVRVERRRRAVLGSILPESGSPSEREFAEWIREGVRARIETADVDGGLPVELEVRDDSGSVDRLPPLVRDLGAFGPVGVIGPLDEESLAAAARARTVPIPLVSPTATRVPDDADAVYSLSAPDPGGPIALARFAVDQALDSAVVLHPRSAEYAFEADRFAEEYERLGGVVLRRIEYDPDATFFEEPFRAVRELLPAALVLPVPAGHIELVAPQITFFGLDTLGVRVLGTAGWSDPDVLREVDSRHTDGVVVATHRAPGGPTPAWRRFVTEYEQVVRRTLRSRVPALGYDAAGLLLEAVAAGARDPEEVAAALEEIEDYPGATGELSIRDGRITRTYHLIRLREREMIPIPLAGD